MMITAIPANGL